MKIPRIAMPPEAVEYLVEHQEEFPTTVSCSVGPLDAEQVDDQDYLQEAIRASIEHESCPKGVYILKGYNFDMR